MLRQLRGWSYMYEKIFDGIREQAHVRDELRMGLVCDACDLGPCTFDGSTSRVPCGITPDEMAMKNLAEKIAEGLGEYKTHKRHITMVYDMESLLEAATRMVDVSRSYSDEIDKLLSPYRTVRTVPFGLGGLRPEAVNICAVSSPRGIHDLIEFTRTPEAAENIECAGAHGVNIVSLGYPGAELAYQRGIPCIGNYLVLDNALATGCIDAIHTFGSERASLEEALKHFASRKGPQCELPEPKMHTTGATLDVTAINRAYERGNIEGVVVLFGAASPTCSWHMEGLVTDLVEHGYLVLVTGAHMYEGSTDAMNAPGVVHIGFCEIGKMHGKGFAPTPFVLVPGWKNAKILTSTLALVHHGYPVITGVRIPLTPSIEEKLAEKGCITELNGERVVERISELQSHREG
ncbi:hypothetical protein EF808_07605 [archaeon]|nr:MAG: hypothetical protein EF808_07605 [archaeon]